MEKAPKSELTSSDDPSASEDTAAQPYIRAANEDDDGYDPYSDRPAAPEGLFEEDPWR